MNTYVSGTAVRTRARNFTNIDGTVADPDTVTLRYRKGSGGTNTVVYPSSPIVKDSVGNYHADLDTSGFAGPGLQFWQVQWTGTGSVAAIGNDSWNVEAPTL